MQQLDTDFAINHKMIYIDYLMNQILMHILDNNLSSSHRTVLFKLLVIMRLLLILRSILNSKGL